MSFDTNIRNMKEKMIRENSKKQKKITKMTTSLTTSLEDITLEEFKAGNASVEKTLLVISGLSTEDAVEQYVAKLDKIEKDFKRKNSRKKRNYIIARALFNYLGEIKDDRYNSDFLLADIIDNQLSEDPNQTVGNCVGLTSLYTVLGQRIGLDLYVLASNFHILSCMTENDKEIIIENTDRFGFDIAHPKPNFKKEELSALVAATLHSRGIDKYTHNRYQEAIKDYDRAIELNPEDKNALNNRGVAKQEIGDYAGAIRDYDKALELNPEDAIAFDNMEVAKKEIREYARAIEDYRKAIDLKPNCVHAIKNLERLIRKTNA